MKTYPLFKVHVVADDALKHVESVLRSGFINEGIEVTQLAHGLQRCLEAPRLVLTNSCTSALTLALRLAQVGRGDYVVSTPMTCAATNTPIVNAGANISWADVDPRHGMVTAETIEAAISTYTKAVVVVAWAGTPPDMAGIRDVCSRKGVCLILDAAHAFGAQYRRRPVHEWADITCYSFQAIKHFTTGDGGAIVCSNAVDAARARTLKWFGLDRDQAKDAKGNWRGQQWDVDIVEAGYKFNMNNVAAAIGLSQLPLIEGVLARHRANAELYDRELKSCTAIEPNALPADVLSSRWTYAARMGNCRLTRDGLLAALNAEGIMAGLVHVPNDAYTCFSQFRRHLPGVRRFSSTQFSMPCGWWIEPDDVVHIARRVKELTT